MQELRIIDLFSGIGGFACAFQPLQATTVGYCDNDPLCQRVLTELISRHYLDKAHIYGDIKTLDIESLKQLRPNMITAGFPCQDISSANPKGLGLKGGKSKLFFDILKVVDAIETIDILFFENSPRIVNKGFVEIKKSLQKRGFNVLYCIVGADDVGALHTRKRWYCLCYKQHVYSKLTTFADNAITYNWSRINHLKRVVKPRNQEHRKRLLERCMLLGNSIVPQAARYAWNLLISKPHLVQNSRVHVNPFAIKRNLKLEFDDGANTAYASIWATPCRSLWHPYTKINKRGIKTLASQLYYSVNTQIEEPDKTHVYYKYVANPKFIEGMMGFKKGWTKVPYHYA